MPEDYAEQIALNGTRPGRPESPALKGSASKAIENAFRELIERSYFYQKVTVDLTDMDTAIKESINHETIKISESLFDPRRPPSFPTPATPQRLEGFRDEVRERPWRLATRHLGDNPTTTEIRRFAPRVGGQPVGTEISDMNLHFYLPPVRLRCPGSCKDISTFIALACSSDSHFDSPYPRKVPGGTEQIFVPVYRCEMCRQSIYTVLIRRVGLRLHLCGFAPRRELLAVQSVPEELLPILNDAEQAVAEGDLFGGFYHLRTMLEHYLKAKLGIQTTDQIRDDDLVAKYYETLKTEIKSVLPSLTSALEKLSAWLHARTGEAEDYQRQRDDICKHIKVIGDLGDAAFIKPPPFHPDSNTAG
jgi:hypothetical protein